MLPAPDDSPTVTFIQEVVEPQRDELNLWDSSTNTKDMLARDAWKRRHLSEHKIGGAAYVLSRSGRTVGGINGNFTSLVSHQAKRATDSLHIARQYLYASEVPTLPSREFSAQQKSKAQEYFAEQASPSIIKPSTVKVQAGAVTQVRSAEEFEAAWERAVEASSGLSAFEQQTVIEPHRPGLHLRLHVVGESITAAITRLPLYVVGDGSTSISDLLHAEFQRRSECNYLSKRIPEVTEDLLQGSGWALQDIPASGEVALLTPTADILNAGGIAVDVLETLTPELKELAISAMWAFPGLSATNVDLVAPQLDSAEGAAVAGVEPGGVISEYLYPAYGTARRVTLPLFTHMIETSRS